MRWRCTRLVPHLLALHHPLILLLQHDLENANLMFLLGSVNFSQTPLVNMHLQKECNVAMIVIMACLSHIMHVTKLWLQSHPLFTKTFIYINHSSECVSWISRCGSSWLCGTIHEYEIYRTLPPLPCPLPPRPPVKPGTCKFNISNGHCSFFPNKSKSVASYFQCQIGAWTNLLLISYPRSLLRYGTSIMLVVMEIGCACILYESFRVQKNDICHHL